MHAYVNDSLISDVFEVTVFSSIGKLSSVLYVEAVEYLFRLCVKPRAGELPKDEWNKQALNPFYSIHCLF